MKISSKERNSLLKSVLYYSNKGEVMTKNIRIYYFLISIVGGIFSTAMPLYYENLHFSSYQIGILIAIPSMAMLFQPMWGIIVDKYKIARELGIFGIVISALVLSLLLFASYFQQVLIIVALYSLIKAPVWSSIDNIIITYCMNNNINYGPLRVFASIAWGSSLILFLPFSLIFGFKSYFILNLAISLYVAYIIFKLPKTTNLKVPKKELGENASFNDGLIFLAKDKTFRYIIIFTLFFSTLFVTNLNYQALYFQQLGQSQLFISVVMFISIMPELFLLPYVEKISGNFNPIKMLMIVSIAYIVKYLIFATITFVPILVITATLHGIAMSFYIPIFIKLIKSSVPNNVSTTAITFNGFVSAIAGIFTSLFAGFLSGHLGITAVFFLVAGFQICGLVILILFYRNSTLKRI